MSETGLFSARNLSPPKIPLNFEFRGATFFDKIRLDFRLGGRKSPRYISNVKPCKEQYWVSATCNKPWRTEWTALLGAVSNSYCGANFGEFPGTLKTNPPILYSLTPPVLVTFFVIFHHRMRKNTLSLYGAFDGLLNWVFVQHVLGVYISCSILEDPKLFLSHFRSNLCKSRTSSWVKYVLLTGKPTVVSD